MAVIVLLWAAGYAGAIAALLRAPPHRAVRGTTTRVLLVRPLCGAPELVARTLSTLPGSAHVDLRWVAAIESPADSAWPPALAAATQLRAAGVDAHVLATAARGPNHKVEQLARALERFGHDRDVLVVADADVDLATLDVDALLTPLHDGAAACWAPPIELAPRTFGDRIGAALLSASLHAFVLLVRIDPRLFVGKAFAVRLDALAAVGGFAPLRTWLGEDFELARRLRAHGFAVACSERPVGARASGRDLRALFDRHARWLAVLRAQRPLALLGVPLVLAAAPLLLALAIVLGSWPALAIVVLARAAVVIVGRRRSGLPCGIADFAYALLVDLLLLAAFVRALATRRVRWADRTLRIGRGGRLAGGDPARSEAGEQRGGEALAPLRGCGPQR